MAVRTYTRLLRGARLVGGPLAVALWPESTEVEQPDTESQILDGLEVGQQVVLHPPDTLTDGAAIAVRPEPR